MNSKKVWLLIPVTYTIQPSMEEDLVCLPTTRLVPFGQISFIVVLKGETFYQYNRQGIYKFLSSFIPLYKFSKANKTSYMYLYFYPSDELSLFQLIFIVRSYVVLLRHSQVRGWVGIPLKWLTLPHSLWMCLSKVRSL